LSLADLAHSWDHFPTTAAFALRLSLVLLIVLLLLSFGAFGPLLFTAPFSEE
jgi:hypothetical protein